MTIERGKGNLIENVTMLDYQNKKIILIATAHVSKESVELVKQVIEEERPLRSILFSPAVGLPDWWKQQ